MAEPILPVPPIACADGRLSVRGYPSREDNLVWVATCVKTGITAVIDGPPDATVIDRLRADGVPVPTVILDTHGHGDHVGINLTFAEAGLPVTVFGPAEVADRVPVLTRAVGEGDVVAIGEVEGRVLRTEGHMDGHVSYVFGDALFCGDTLFAGGCGYLFDGPASKMFDSLVRLAALPSETRVFCAHEYTKDNLRFAWSVEPGNRRLAARIADVWAARAAGRCTLPSTIEEERATNPFLRPGAPEIVAAAIAASPAVNPADPLSVFTAVRKLKDTKAYKSIPDADLPLAPQSRKQS